jgi:hypothetical protein
MSGSFNGTGADLWICCGFVPDWVHLWNLVATAPVEVVWNKQFMRTLACCEGFIFTWDSTFGSSDAEQIAIGAGIQPYFGGDTLVSGTGTLGVGTTTYGSTSAVYLQVDPRDYRYTNDDSPFGVGDAAESTIDSWTSDVAASYSGNFGTTGAVTGTYIGVGSPICIDGNWYVINTLTADGGDTGDVVLNMAAASGEIQHIGGMYGMRSLLVGDVTPAGFMVGNATLNASGNMVIFEAGQYDR